MEIDLYPLRRKLQIYFEQGLPYFKDINPHWVSALLLPFGLLTAWVYTYAQEYVWLYLIGSALIALRMMMSALASTIAAHNLKRVDQSALFNKLCLEFADIALMIAIALNSAENSDLALWAIGIGWASSYLALIGLAWGKPIQSVGPVDSNGRLIALVGCSILSTFMGHELWMQVFLWWCIFGGLVTCGLRLQRQLYEVSSSEH